MQESKIILTSEAIYDIADIADYIEEEFGIQRADKFQDEIQKQIFNLSVFGNAYRKTHICYRDYNIFRKPFPPSIIFYIIIEPQKEIHILRVLREECDWEKTLTEQQQYTYQ